MKCKICRSKINIISFECKFCKINFCSKHQLPEDHHCDIKHSEHYEEYKYRNNNKQETLKNSENSYQSGQAY